MKPISPMRGMLPAGVMPVVLFSLFVFGYFGEDLAVVRLQQYWKAKGCRSLPRKKRKKKFTLKWVAMQVVTRRWVM